jgi:2-polyprenyl-3-methyl-5-hydroxy-6-metoxy-1,4-benzoquinol methylase
VQETDELERLDRERRHADARYNEALTALDHAVVSMSGRERSVEDFDRTATVLLQFLQQITLFVESKDRHLDAAARARLDNVAHALEPIPELRTQVTVLQRAVEALKRSPRSVDQLGSSSASRQTVDGATAGAIDPHDDYKYVAFEDAFRGSDTAIESRLRAYVPLFAGASNVLDVGCGRGELLSALRSAGVAARGIDTNGEMVAVARARGLDAQQADALAYVNAVPDGSFGGLIATQVIEHLEPAYLLRLIDAASRKLQPRAPIVLETINPACWLAFFSSYIRDFTHVRPIHPETLQYLLRASGFAQVEIRYSAPVPEHMKMKTIDLPGDVLRTADPAAAALVQIAHTLNANAVILNNLMFSHLDYAAIGYRI